VLLLAAIGLTAYFLYLSPGKSTTRVAAVPPGTVDSSTTNKRPTAPTITAKPPPATERKRTVEPWLAALPEGTTALVAVHVANLAKTPFFRDIEAKLPEEYGKLREDLGGLGVDLHRNVAFAAIGLSASVEGRSPDRRFLVFQGDFSRAAYEKMVATMKLKLADPRRPREPVYRVEQPDGPAYLAMVGENLLIFGSNPDEVAAVFERVAAARPPHHIRDKSLRSFLEKTDSPAAAVVYVSGSFVPPDQREPASLEKLLHIRGLLCLAKVATIAECRLAIDVGGEPTAWESETIRRVLEEAARQDNPLGRFVRQLTKNGPKPDGSRIVYQHNFTPAEVTIVFPKAP
jgi:hypothetical protein